MDHNQRSNYLMARAHWLIGHAPRSFNIYSIASDRKEIQCIKNMASTTSFYKVFPNYCMYIYCTAQWPVFRCPSWHVWIRHQYTSHITQRVFLLYIYKSSSRFPENSYSRCCMLLCALPARTLSLRLIDAITFGVLRMSFCWWCAIQFWWLNFINMYIYNK